MHILPIVLDHPKKWKKTLDIYVIITNMFFILWNRLIWTQIPTFWVFGRTVLLFFHSVLMCWSFFSEFIVLKPCSCVPTISDTN
jgi:hypothetical protein